MASKRQNFSFLNHAERMILAKIVRRIPSKVLPIHLTFVGVIGALIAAAGLVLTNASPWFAVLICIGLVVNWFGDSLDGSLARYRKIERPRFGFLVDHSTDLMTQTIIIVSFGLSPFLSMTDALAVLVMYLLFCGYTYIRVSVYRVHVMAYGGMGATEFRIMMMAWSCVAAARGPELYAARIGVFSVVDVIIVSLSIGAFVLLVNTLIADADRVAEEEGQPTAAPSTPRGQVIKLSVGSGR